MVQRNSNRRFYALIVSLSLMGFICSIGSLQARGVLVRYHNDTPLQGLALNTRSDVVRLEADADEVESLVKNLNQDPDVEYAEPDYPLQIGTLPTDPFYDAPYDTSDTFYNYHMIDMIDAWDIVSSCDNIIVAIIDTGIDPDHPDLQDNIWVNALETPNNGIDDDGNGYIDDWNGYDFYDNDNHINDIEGHGSRVAGIIGAVGNNNIGLSGLCLSAQILPVKAFGDDGVGNTSAAIEAIRYAVDQGARVLNLSWTITSGYRSQFLEEAIEEAAAAGAIVVTAAGNAQQNLDDDPVYPASYELSNLIAVAAHGPSGSLAYYSNFGEETVDLAAPGNQIMTTNNHGVYASFTGTSAAAPHVSGAAALMLSLQPELSPEQLATLLVNNAETDDLLSGLVVSSNRLNILNAASAINEVDPDYEETLPPDPNESESTFAIQGGCSLIRN